MNRSLLRAVLLVLLCACTLSLFGCLELLGLPDGKVRFYVDGELYQTVEPTEDGTFDIPVITPEQGYTFDGWYSDPLGTTPYEGEAKAYAFLRPIAYDLIYRLNGGVSDNPSFYTVQTPTFTLRAPEKEGYTFVGWTTDAQTTPVPQITIPKGSHGSMTLTAHYTPTVFTITYELDGGTSDNPTSYTIESDSFTLTPPTRPDSTFYAWECNGTLYESYTVAQGSFGDLVLRAVWNTGLPMLSYAADTAGVTVTSNTPAGGVEIDTRVTVTAPATSGDRMFLYWLCNGELLSYAASHTFTMGSETRTLVACYDAIDSYEYDKKSGQSFTFSLDSKTVPYAIYGGGAGNDLDVILNRGSVTLTADYLTSLPCGYYSFFIDDATGGQWCSLSVIDSRTPTDVAIVYDHVSYPAVVLTFTCSCAGEHTYSLDGGNAVLCTSGDVLPSYDKSAEHTLTLSCVKGGSVTVTREGYTRAEAPYYEDSFSYGGQVYDYVIESEEEYEVLYEYLIAVRGVLDHQDGKGDLSYTFLASEYMGQVINDQELYDSLMTRAFHAKSFPMLPSVQISYRTQAPYVCTLTIEYPYGLNEQLSAQTPIVLQDTSNPERTEGRPSDFNSFPIDAFPPTAVRTMYELELLPYGLCPTFEDADSDAARLYERARAILRTIVDDGMDDYQKVAAIYRYLAHNVTYDEVTYASADGSVYRAFTAYGALMDGVAVCDGYASAFRLLCLIEGIPCEEYTGVTDPYDPASGHAWNKYTIDGVTYACDVTWARVEDQYVTMYYVMMDEALLLDTDHFENALEYDAFTAVCADAMFDYFDRIGTENDSCLVATDPSSIADAIAFAKANGLTSIELWTSYDDQTILEILRSLRLSVSVARTSEETVCIILEP